jgi:hypothetical protein
MLLLGVLTMVACGSILWGAAQVPAYEAAVFDTDTKTNGWLMRLFPLGGGKETDVHLPGFMRPLGL